MDLEQSVEDSTEKIEKKSNEKGTGRMPWLQEAMKDVASCDKPRGAASKLRSGDFRMGKPDRGHALSFSLY